jgi:arylsulfatase A-like enzyme
MLLATASIARAQHTAPLTTEASGPPNILFILTDDLDEYTYEKAMPKTQTLIEDQGVRFDNATYSMSNCCPSRASILRGQYTHNTGVWDNKPPNGGFEAFKHRGLNGDTYATRINKEGYRTAYFGKYMNGYPKRGKFRSRTAGGRLIRYYVPPGWDSWYGSTKNISNPQFVSRNGTVDDPKGAHDVVVGNKAASWLRGAVKGSTPFLGVVNFHAPHSPAWHPQTYRNKFASKRLPRPPSFDESNLSDKPPYVRKNGRIGASEKRSLTAWHRKRLRSAAYADTRIKRLMRILSSSGELRNTYVFFYSDNGYHLGQHRLPSHTVGGKGTPYVEDVRFPIIVRGPNIEPNTESEAMVQNIDLRPTFEDIANATTPGYVDGISLLKTARSAAPFPRKFAYSEKLGAVAWRAVYTPHTAYHLNLGGFEEFYSLHKDKWQLDGTISSEEESLAPAHRDALAHFRKCGGNPSSCKPTRP